MSNRKITNIQFSDGSVIAGDQLDAAWADVQRRFDALKLSDVERKWWETQLVFGYEPRRNSWTHDVGPGATRIKEMPWMNLQIINADDSTLNQFKGADFPGISPPNYGVGYVWAINWTTGPSPQVITALDWFLESDRETAIYPITWQWLANMPAGLQANDYVEDCGMEIVVDHPTSQGDPEATSVLCYKAGVSVDSQIQTVVPAFASTMSPAFPSGFPAGVWFHAENLHLPVPPNARVRVFLILPDYLQGVSEAGNPIVAGDVRWRTTIDAPWSLQAYSGSVTVLLPRGEDK